MGTEGYHNVLALLTLESGCDVMYFGSGRSPIKRRIVIHTASEALKRRNTVTGVHIVRRISRQAGI